MRISSSDLLSRRAFIFSYAAAMLMLLVAPFPSSAGLRGALLLLSAIGLILVLVRNRGSSSSLPSRLLMVSALAWIFTVALFSVFGPDPRASLSAWRGAVLSPALACGVFYVLTTTRRDVLRFSLVLLVGVVVLSVMLVHDPFRPEDPTHSALYGGVGRVTMWFTTLAPLLPLAWLAPRRWRHLARLGCVVAVLAILIGTWYSGNRAAWISYAVMLIVGTLAAIWSAKPRGISLRALLMVIPLLAILGAGFYASSTYRANVHTNNSETPVEFLLKDNRSGIWRTALEMIEEKPWVGHGYDLDRVGDDFTSRLSDTRLRGFIRHGHNVLLDYAIQMGVLAAAILALLFVALFREFWRLAGSHKNERDQLARVAAICGIALITGVFARNMIDDFFSRHMILLFGAMIGMLLGVANRSQSKR
jgi:O-antigen ligase